MDAPLTVLHLADSHIGAELPARRRRGAHRRGDDFIDSYHRALSVAGRVRPDLVLHAGDVFDTPAPGPAAITSAAEPLRDIAANGIPVVIVPGNHERSAIPGGLLFSHPNVHIAREPCTFWFRCRDARVAVSVLPCVRRGVARRFAAALDQTDWRRIDADIRILLIHQTIESAVCGPGNFRFRSGDDVVERDAIPPEFHYVAAGHVHRHQVLTRDDGVGPPIVYAGSTDRITFAERDEPKGVVLARFDGPRCRIDFVEHDVRSLHSVTTDVTGRSRTQVIEETNAVLRQVPPGALVSVRLVGCATPGQLRGLALARSLASLRPDLFIRAHADGLEFVEERVVRSLASAGGDASTFAWAAGERCRVAPDALRDAPDGCGAYAAADESGRLLYVGKALRVRARLRQHFRASADGVTASEWAGRAAWIDVRPCGGELEALLCEAETIRRARPAFNRQMRAWRRYGYLRADARAAGGLATTRGADAGVLSFGPYRSRGSAERVAQAAAEHFGDSLPASLVALLAGQSDESIAELEAAAVRLVEACREDAAARRLAVRAETLRAAFEHGAALREAEALRGAVLVLPPVNACVSLCALLPDGLELLRVPREAGAVELAAARILADVKRSGEPAPDRLRIHEMEALLVCVRMMRRDPRCAARSDSDSLRALDAHSLARRILADDERYRERPVPESDSVASSAVRSAAISTRSGSLHTPSENGGIGAPAIAPGAVDAGAVRRPA